MFSSDTTIAAIATAPGNAGVAVLRLSGPGAWAIGQKVFRRNPQQNTPPQFKAGRFYHGWIIDPASPKDAPTLIDEVLVLVFQGPKSFTGEDVIEIHCHGGQLLSQQILSLCLNAGAVPAEPGEFTKRAFLNGKMDLTQAESVMDLVSAQSTRMVSMASTNLKHRSLGQYVDGLIAQLLNIQAQIVASVDFPDEVDEPDRAPLMEILEALITSTQALRVTSQRNRMAREGFKVALLGLPNSGKSSLFNALLANERAIVTDIAGTTRDLITEALFIGGVHVTLTDTAGIHDAHHAIEQMGIERSWQAAQDADAVVYVYDLTRGLSGADEAILAKLVDTPTLVAGNKVDLCPSPPNALTPQAMWTLLNVSAQQGSGLEAVFEWLEQVIQQQSGESSGGLSVALNQRQIRCIEAVADHLHQAHQTLADVNLPIDLTTVPLTAGMRQLDELLGRDTTDEMLTQVFSQFCVGK